MTSERRLRWHVVTITEIRAESETASTFVLDIADPGGQGDLNGGGGPGGWGGHLAGQHVDVRLTAEDGYQAQRSYSIASAGAPAPPILEITVQRVPDGEVSPYLVDVARPGDQFEVRGPVGGYFTWQPGGARAGSGAPVLAIAGGSGVVPLMSIARTHAAAAGREPFRLVYSARSPDEALYAADLAALAKADVEIDVAWAYTRAVPPGWPEPPGRLTAARLAKLAFPPADEPVVYVCGPTGFVEHVANLLVDAGHNPSRVKTERFGPTGG